jgi:hypothetical protein
MFTLFNIEILYSGQYKRPHLTFPKNFGLELNLNIRFGVTEY